MQLLKLIVFSLAMLLGTAAMAQNNNFGYTGTGEYGTSTTKGWIISKKDSSGNIKIAYWTPVGMLRDTSMSEFLDEYQLKSNMVDNIQNVSTTYPNSAAVYQGLLNKVDIDVFNDLQDTVNAKLDTSYQSVVTALLALKMDTSYASIVIDMLADSMLVSRAYTDTKFLSVGSAALQGIALTSTNPGANVAGRWWFGNISASPQTFTNFSGLTAGANESILLIDNGTTYEKLTLPLLPLMQQEITAQGLINATTFETVSLPIYGAVKTRYNHGTLSSYTSNYGTSLTRIIDSSFSYNGTVTKIEFYSTRNGTMTWKTLTKNGDGTYNVIGSTTFTAVVGLNTIDSAALTNMPVKVGGTAGWFGSASTGGGVGFLAGSTFATKTLTGNVSGNNLTFSASSASSVWGVKLTYRVSPSLALDSVVRPYGSAVSPIYTRDVSYSGGADSLSNMFSTGTITNDMAVKSDGTVGALAGWKYVAIPITDKQPYVFVSKIAIRPASLPNSGYWRFASGSGATLSFGGYTSSADTSYPVPTGAVSFQIDIQDPSTTSSAYADATISYRGKLVTKLLGVPIGSSGGGGTDYDQSLNTTDDVEFNTLTTGGLLLKNVPTGNGTEPVGLPLYGIWVDWDGITNSGILKVKMQ